MAKAADKGYLEALIAEGQTRYRDFHALCDRIEDLFHRRHVIEVPDAYKKTALVVKTPTVEDIVRRAVALLTEGYPTASMVPSEPGPAAQGRADKIEAWLNACFPQLEKQSGRTVFRNVVEDAVKFGVGWLWCEFLPDAWEEYDGAVAGPAARVRDPDTKRLRKETGRERAKRLDLLARRQPLPWHLTDLDPRSVYAFKDAFGIREVLVATERARLEVGKKYDLGFNGQSLYRYVTAGEAPGVRRGELGEGTPIDHGDPLLTNWGTVRFYTHFDRTYVTYYADGQILRQEPHGYNRPPIFECRGLSTTSRDPARSYRSLVAPVLDLVPELDTLLTFHHNWAHFSAMPMLQEIPQPNSEGGLPEIDVDEDGKPLPPPKYTPGEIRRGSGRIEPIQLPNVGPALQSMIALLQTEIEKVTPLPPILKGLSPGADTPGYSVNQLRQEARTIHQVLLGNVATAYESLAEFILWSIEHRVEDPVYVVAADPGDERRRRLSYVALAPDDIRGYHHVDISITADAPQHDIALLRAGLEAWGAGALPLEYVLEKFGKIANAQQVIDDRMLEDAMKNPKVQEYLIGKLFERAGLTKLIEGISANQGTPPQPIDAGAPAGPGLPGTPMPPAAGELPPQPPGLPPPGALPGVMQGVNTAMEPGGFPQNV